MRYVTSWVLATVLLVAACGGSDDDQSGAEVETAVASVDSVTGNEDRTADADDDDRAAEADDDGESTGEELDDGGIGFVPWGPDDPPVPGRYFNLHADSADDLDCDSVESEAPPDDPFWELVVAVCRGITGEAGWPAPAPIPPSPPVENGFQACMDAELATMLEAAMAWRAEHPDARPEVDFPTAGTESSCRSEIFAVRVDPVDGGIELGLATADPEPDRVELKVDGTVVTADPDRPYPDDLGSGLTGIVYFVPAPVEAHTATLEVTNAYGSSTTTVDLPAIGGNETTGTGDGQDGDAGSPDDATTDTTPPDVTDPEPDP